MRQIIVIVLSSVLLAWIPTTQTSAQQGAPELKLVGYYTSFDIYDRQYFVTDIPAQLLTHINYAYVDISENGQCVSSDDWADTQYAYPDDKPYERVRGNFKQLQLVKKNNPALQILMSIGGWEHSRYFSDVALTPESRTRFVRSCVAFMRANGFDGIDVDWRFPVSGGGPENSARPEDRVNFSLLLSAFREQLDSSSDQDGQRYLLTMAAPAIESLYSNIQLDQVHISVDWINLMAFGFQGSWSEVASHQAPLYGNTRDPRGDIDRKTYNVDAAVTAFMDAGVPADKIVLCVPFYAQTWQDVQNNDFFGLYQPNGGVPSGTRPGGILFYSDLAPLLESDRFVRFFDEETRAPWLYNATERIAVSYEDQESILNKMLYVRTHGLGGAAVWELSYDDADHTLLNATSSGLHAQLTQPSG